ncbi:MAG: D-lactate dehydrogenase (acceptor) [Methanonatronarchaeales archaeon]|nr:D-lactate dehydrogenase (acceptor) [Methanonatronarchaeales archaeon]
MEPREVAAELSELVEGRVRADDVTRELYSTAACIYRERPLVVVEPMDLGDVVETVRFASRSGVPITARGAGSSLAGQALGPGVVMDLSVNMDSVLDVDEDEMWVEVEPGVVLSDLNSVLEERGLFFPPDPSSADFCTLGGMLANNSSGAHSLRYGDTRDYTLGLEVVLADDSVACTGELGDDLDDRVSGVLSGREELVEEWTPDVSKNCSGYCLEELLETGDPTSVFVGSEGTLGVFTRARLRVERVPDARSTVLLHFSSLGDAGEAVPRLLGYAPSAVEIMDSTFISLVREKRPDVGEMIPVEADTSLLVEFDGGGREVEESMEAALRATVDLALDSYAALDDSRRGDLWRVRTAGLPLLYGREGDRRVTPFIEDVVVPPGSLPTYVERLGAILDRHGVEFVVYGHAGEGNVHARPLLDLDDAGDRERMRAIADEVFDLVVELGGTISGEHGDGYLRTGFLEKQYGPLADVFRDLKDALDPSSVLNPGKIVGPDRMTEGLRPFAVEGLEPPVAGSVEGCHGCGMCRGVSGGRTCPVFRLRGVEEASPRARANVARGLAEGTVSEDEAARVFSACLGCRSCHEECYTGVDAGEVSMLHREPDLRGAVFGTYGVLGRLGRTLPIEPPEPPAFAKALLGVTRSRQLPAFEGPSLGEALPAEPAGDRPIALFAGCHVAYYDPGPALALAEVLERCGYTAYLPKQACCGMPMLAAGQRVRAESVAERNVESLPEDVPVVSTCPGCVVALRMDYPGVMGVEHDLRLYEAFEFLDELRGRDEFVEPNGTVEGAFALHEPCHSRVLGGSGCRDFLAPVAGLAEIEDGCCGMGGSFGFTSEGYGDSVEIGRDLFGELDASGATPVTECPSCEIQLGHALGEAKHPLEVLREAYR